MVRDEFTLGSIISRTRELVRGNARSALFWTCVLTALTTGLAALGGGNRSGGVIPGAVSLFGEYTITSELLAGLGLMLDGYRTRPFWAILGVCLLSNIGIVLGLVMFIVPGLILATRWILCVPVLVAEERGVFDSMAESWRQTTGRFWPILGFLLVLGLTVLVLVSVLEALTFGAVGLLAMAAVYNLLVYAAIVIAWHAAVAIYELLRPGSAHLGEVFA